MVLCLGWFRVCDSQGFSVSGSGFIESYIHAAKAPLLTVFRVASSWGAGLGRAGPCRL